MVLYSIMKKGKLFIKRAFIASLCTLFIVSCASTSKEKSDEPKKSKEEIVEIQEPVIPEPTKEQIFLESLEGIKLQFTKIPSKTKKNKNFDSAYELIVTDKDENPVADFEVAFIVPVKNSENQITGSRECLTTDENGCISYTPSTPDFAAKTTVCAYPFVPDNLEIADEEIAPYKVYADYIVESDVAAKGAIMFVFEYTESGKPSKNSYDILSGLRKKGVYMIGNAPISDTDYINASKQKIYKENYNIVGTDYGYLIGGTIKFDGPVEQTEDGYIARLTAEIYGIDMKTGNVIYENTHKEEAAGKNWNYAVSDCKDKLTKTVVDSIMFGL